MKKKCTLPKHIKTIKQLHFFLLEQAFLRCTTQLEMAKAIGVSERWVRYKTEQYKKEKHV